MAAPEESKRRERKTPDGASAVTSPTGVPDVPTTFVRDGGGAPPPRRSAREWLGLVGVVAIVAFLGVGFAFAFDLDRAGTASFWLLAIGPTFLVGIGALVRAYRDGEVATYVRPEWGDATRAILSAVLLLGAAVVFTHVVTPAGSPRESWMARLYLQIGDPTWLRSHNVLVACVVLVAALGEEVVWRGLVTQLIAEKTGSRTAWLWAAVPYAAASLPTVWALRDPVAGLNPVLVLGALGMGVVWGGMARWNRRLAPSILSHAAFDWSVLVLFRLWGSGA